MLVKFRVPVQLCSMWEERGQSFTELYTKLLWF